MKPWATNTCPLDSFLEAIFLPYKAQLLVNHYPELADPASLLSQTFGLLNKNDCNGARMLWIQEFLGHENPHQLNLWGFTDVFFASRAPGRRLEDWTHPFHRSCEIIFQKTRHCVREGGCESDQALLQGGRFDTNANDSDDEIVLAEDGTLRQYRLRRIVCLEQNRTMLQHLESILNEKQEPNCDRQVCDPTHAGALHSKAGGWRNCKGPSVRGQAEVTKWPHTMVFDVNGGGSRGIGLNDSPLTFEWTTRTFVLRSAVIGGGGHFTCVVRCPNGWLHCDGMNSKPRLRMHSLGASNCSFMVGKNLDFLLYECLNNNLEKDTFGNPNFDLSTVILTDQSPQPDISETNDNLSTTSPSSDQEDKQLTQESISQGLQETKDEVSKKKNEKPKEKTEKQKHKRESKRKSRPIRIPMGFSVRVKNQTKGPRPTCKGCGIEIGYSELCIRHKYTKYGNKFPTTEQFHGNARCLENGLDELRQLEFCKKKWTNKVLLKVVEDLDVCHRRHYQFLDKKSCVLTPSE